MSNRQAQTVKNILQESIILKQKMISFLTDDIVALALAMSNCLKKGGIIYIMGNGGSAADAQHFAAELVGRFHKMERRPLPAISLTTNTSLLTSISNDYDFSIIFARQLEAFLSKKDMVIGISTSGNALNVFYGLKRAIQIGAKTALLTGKKGGIISKKLTKINNLIKVPSDNTARVQEAHITIIHVLCELIESKLFNKH